MATKKQIHFFQGKRMWVIIKKLALFGIVTIFRLLRSVSYFVNQSTLPAPLSFTSDAISLSYKNTGGTGRWTVKASHSLTAPIQSLPSRRFPSVFAACPTCTQPNLTLMADLEGQSSSSAVFEIQQPVNPLPPPSPRTTPKLGAREIKNIFHKAFVVNRPLILHESWFCLAFPVHSFLLLPMRSGFWTLDFKRSINTE